MNRDEIKREIIEMLPLLDIGVHGCGNGAMESYRYACGRVEAYLNVLGIKIEGLGYSQDIERIKSALNE